MHALSFEFWIKEGGRSLIHWVIATKCSIIRPRQTFPDPFAAVPQMLVTMATKLSDGIPFWQILTPTSASVPIKSSVLSVCRSVERLWGWRSPVCIRINRLIEITAQDSCCNETWSSFCDGYFPPGIRQLSRVYCPGIAWTQKTAAFAQWKTAGFWNMRQQRSQNF